MTNAAPGWYPVDEYTVRYWDGLTWVAPLEEGETMSKPTTCIETFTIISVDRMKSSAAGNPRFMFALANDSGVILRAASEPNAGWAFRISGNNYGQKVQAEIGTYRGKASVKAMRFI